MMRNFLYALLIAAGFGLNGYGQQKMDIYLLMGQSNMAGRGKLTDENRAVSDPKVFMLNKDQKWVTAKHPLHFDKSVAAVGPGLAFGMEMKKFTKKRAIGLVPCAVGGTSINHWVPGAYDKATDSHPWDDAEVRIKEAMKTGTIRGVIWHQGESDSHPDSAALYMNKLENLITRVRALTGNPGLPFVAGELGRYKESYSPINAVLAGLPEKVRGTAVVSSEGFVHNGDGVHFDAPSADEFGKRYAKAMNRLVRKGK
jgi:hypothetical protein